MAQIAPELLQEIKNFANNSNSYFGNMLKRIQGDLEFASSSQFDDKDSSIRGAGRAEFVFNILRNYLNQVINSFRAHPYGVQLTARTNDAKMIAQKLQAVLQGIESRAKGQQAYAIAVDRQVKAGRGYVVVSTQYANENTFDQELILQGVLRPDMVIWSPHSTEVDGRDCMQACFVEHQGRESARELFGPELVPEYGKVASILGGTRWAAPEDSVEVLTYFKMKKTKTKIFVDESGSILPQDQVRKNSKMKNRETTKTTCVVTRIVGDQFVGETELPLSRLPIIPFLGEVADISKKIDWVGLTYYARDPSRLINWTASLTAERIAIGPKSTIFVDYRSIAKYKDLWQQANKLNLPFLPFDSKVEDDDTQYGPPTPRDAAVNISDVTSAVGTFQSIMSSIMGLPEAGKNVEGPSNETAASVLTKAKSSDMSNYCFADNASQSIAAITQVMLELVPVIYDTARPVPVAQQNAKGYALEEMDLGAMDIRALDFEVAITSGPLEETTRAETTNQLLALGAIVGPEASLTFASNLARSLDFEDSNEVADKLEAYASSKTGIGGQGGEDPQAVAALQQASAATDALQAELDQAKAYIAQLQAETLGNQASAQARIVEANIKAENNLEVETLKQQGTLVKTKAEITAKAASDVLKSKTELAKTWAKQQEMAAHAPEISNPDQVQMDSVGGMQNQIFGQ